MISSSDKKYYFYIYLIDYGKYYLFLGNFLILVSLFLYALYSVVKCALFV